jgi:KamA family protein
MNKNSQFRAYSGRKLDSIPQFDLLPAEIRHDLRIVSKVLPFRVNNYVLDTIDWRAPLDDPIFRLVFPNRDMLTPADFLNVERLVESEVSAPDLQRAIFAIRERMNPQPGGQVQLNRPILKGTILNGMQHKYRETVLFFPSEGQYCHSYCTFCFRWAQFVQGEHVRFYAKGVGQLVEYLRGHKEVTDVLITGGDPMVMKTRRLKEYIAPLLHDRTLSHVTNIRIGTKALTFWPYRFLTDDDSDDLLTLFEEIIRCGKHLAIMAHFNHPVELEADACRAAIKRIRSTGAEIRSQAPLIRTINDNPIDWIDLWKEQIRLGVIPYYMFVERDTGPYEHFRVPLAKCVEVFQEAIRGLSGLARTVRGPVMSCESGKVHIQDVTKIGEKKVFVLQFIQARSTADSYRTFFAEFDPDAHWFDDLRPAIASWNLGSI